VLQGVQDHMHWDVVFATNALRLLLLLLQAAHGQVIDGDTYRAAEPDLLRHAADELITTWNR
jgi:hypothetical protein